MFRRKLPRSHITSYGAGYKAPSTEGVLTGDPLLETRASSDDESSLSSQKAPPRLVSLRVQLVPVPIVNAMTQIQLIENKEELNPLLLYSLERLKTKEFRSSLEIFKRSQNQSVKLIHTGVAHSLDTGFPTPLSPHSILKLKEGALVYEKRFQTQMIPKITQRRTTINYTTFVTPPGQKECQQDLIPLLGYGGYFGVGETSVHDICQTYFTINQIEGTTTQELFLIKNLLKEGISPLEGGRSNKGVFIFLENMPRQDASLGRDILEGFITLTLILDGKSYSYESVDFNQRDLGSSLVDIHFQPE